VPIPSSGPGLDRGLLRDDVHRRLRDAIVDGTFAPGEQLRDLELAAWPGVSRTPVREALLRLAQGGLVRALPGRSAAALAAGDVEEALLADDELHGVPVRIAGNRAVETVLEQFTPTVRRAERLRFASLQGRESVAQHDELIRLCAAGDVAGAAAVAYDTWSSLPSAEP